MNLKDLGNIQALKAIISAASFRIGEIFSYEDLRKNIGLYLSRAGYYGLYDPNTGETSPLELDQTVFTSSGTVTILVEGTVLLPRVPSITGGGTINYVGKGSLLLSSDNSSIYTGAGAGAWGTITGLLSNQTDLQTALNLKQATLVSATNIRTINGVPVLGAGDITVTGSAIVKDAIPTIGSTNVVQSGGVATQLLQKTNTNDFLQWANKTYLHSRGDIEYEGDASYQTGGVGVYITVVTDTTLNTIKSKAASAVYGTNVFIRVYKTSGTVSGAIPNSAWTFIEEFQQQWDIVNTNFKTVKLTTPLTLLAGESLIVLYSSKSAISTSQRKWTTDPFTDRTKLLYSTNTTSAVFDNAWSLGNTAFWGVFPLLSLETNLLTVEDKTTKLTIPSNIYCVVGTEINLYSDAIILPQDMMASSPLNLSVVYTCAKGVNRRNSWQYTPVVGDIGTYLLTISVYDNFKKLLQRKIVTLNVLAKTAPSSVKNGVCIGDSTTANGSLIPTLLSNFTALGSNSPVLWGTQGTGLNKHEGRPGWAFLTFISAGSPLVNGSVIDIANYRSTLGMGSTVVEQCKSICAGFLVDNPSTKIIIQLALIANSNTSGWGPAIHNKEEYELSVFNLRLAMLKAFDNAAYNVNVSVGIAGLGVDRYYGYNYNSQAAAARIATTIEIHTDNVHPKTEGYNQAADMVFPLILKNL